MPNPTWTLPTLAFGSVTWKMPILKGATRCGVNKRCCLDDVCLQLFSERLFKVNKSHIQSSEKTNTKPMIKGRLSERIKAHLFLWKPLIFSLLIAFLREELLTFSLGVFLDLFVFPSYYSPRNRFYPMFSESAFEMLTLLHFLGPSVVFQDVLVYYFQKLHL